MNTDNVGESHPIRHLSHVRCTGQESRLMDCSHEGIGVHTCGSNSNENAAVMCSDESSVTPVVSVGTKPHILTTTPSYYLSSSVSHYTSLPSIAYNYHSTSTLQLQFLPYSPTSSPEPWVTDKAKTSIPLLHINLLAFLLSVLVVLVIVCMVTLYFLLKQCRNKKMMYPFSRYEYTHFYMYQFKRFQLTCPSAKRDEPVYEEVAELHTISSKPTETNSSCMDIKTEQNMAYQTTKASILTSLNEAYGSSESSLTKKHSCVMHIDSTYVT